jgi:hypothetical protein
VLADAQAAEASTKQSSTRFWLSAVGVVLGSVALAVLAQLPLVRAPWARLAPVLLRADVVVPLLVIPVATLLHRAWSTSDRFADLSHDLTADAAAAEPRLKADAADAEQRLKADAAAAEQRLKVAISEVVKEAVLVSEVRSEKRVVDWARAATAMSAGHAARAAHAAQMVMASATAAQPPGSRRRRAGSR